MSYCLLNKKNLFYNIDKFSKYIPKDKIGIVLKRNAYGHGLLEMASLVQEYGIRHVIVKDSYEACKISRLFDSVLVLFPDANFNLPSNVSLSINSLADLIDFPPGTKIELKIDTGMHRNGILPEEIDDAVAKIKKNSLKLKGVFTHFANVVEDNDSIFTQKKVFDDCIGMILKYKWEERPRFHCSNTAGTIRFDNSEYDLVRIGLGAYGYVDIDEIFDPPDLTPVLSLWANRICSRKIGKGETVGYGNAYKAGEAMMVSSYDIGYGDGFFRLDENDTFQLDNGNPVLGRVSMDCFSAVGNEENICVFSSVKVLAKIHNTIEYEILAGINPKIKRIIN